LERLEPEAIGVRPRDRTNPFKPFHGLFDMGTGFPRRARQLPGEEHVVLGLELAQVGLELVEVVFEIGSARH
jgi:hypothetical protein